MLIILTDGAWYEAFNSLSRDHMANVKRIVRYLRKRGLVRAKTVSMYGREVIRMVRLR